ncbi:MAG TPA: type II toxin-antitoxin system prevent-host-death family antitoxin [Desulfatiglandales bacterium]|nr:type II toxin-antitoxin system prevent-host-death family antitoxin [Desulfatiglandales bacterium]
MTTQTYNIKEVKANLSRLLEKVASGAEVIISREGKPMARISRLEASLPKIRFGVLKDKVKVAEDFDAPLPDELISEFEGGPCVS